MDTFQSPFSWSDSWDPMGQTHRPVPEKVWGFHMSWVAGAISWLFAFAHLPLALVQDLLKRVRWHLGYRHNTKLGRMLASSLSNRKQKRASKDAPSQGQPLCSKQHSGYWTEIWHRIHWMAFKTQLYDLHKVTGNADGWKYKNRMFGSQETCQTLKCAVFEDTVKDMTLWVKLHHRNVTAAPGTLCILWRT